MSNLLEKASIVTTPTSYDNGKILSVKPEEVLSEELVTNGDFSNGSTGWTLGTGWTIEANQLVRAVAVSGSYAQTSYDLGVIGRLYKISINVTEVLSGTLYVYGGLGGTPALTITSAGVYTINHIWASDQPLGVFCSNSFVGKVTNVSVKEAIDGDFDFTRNSSATRVNSQGLIEDVQILSGNLVSNGDFSQEGSEEVTNGNFATDSDWGLQSGWSISGNSLIGTNVNIYTKAYQTLNTKANTYYQVTIDVEELGSSVYVFFQSTVGQQWKQITSVGVHTFQILSPIINSTIYIENADNSNPNIKINNVSVKEVGQDWTLSNAWSIGTSKAIFSDTIGGDIRTSSNVFTANKKYQIKLTVADLTSGTAFFGVGDGAANNLANYANYANGEHTFNVTAPIGQELRIYSTTSSGSSYSISNISVIEITDDTNLPRINYEGFSYQDSLGSELVSNGEPTCADHPFKPSLKSPLLTNSLPKES